MWEQVQKTDEEIAKSVQSGNTDVFGILVELYEEKIKRYARKFLSGQEDIKDVVQNIFIKAYENIQSFDTNRKFSSWLYRIAHNELVNALKKKKRSPLLFFDFDTFFPYPVEKSDPVQKVEFQEMRQILDKCLGKLDSKYREPLILYYFEELGYKEIADVLRIPISTVGIRLKRGREILKSIYQKLNQ